MISGSEDATVRLWDVSTGKEIRRMTGLASAVWSVSYSSDGKYLAAGSQDGTLLVWVLATGNTLRQYKRGDEMVYGVAFGVHQDDLFSADASGILRIWRLALDLNSLQAWTIANRYVGDLSCSEQELYQLAQSCNEASKS